MNLPNPSSIRKRSRPNLIRSAILILTIAAWTAGPAWAQVSGLRTASSLVGRSVEQAARAAVAGPDLVGKDGPMAAVGYELALLHAAATSGTVAPQALRNVIPDIAVLGDSVLIDAIATGSASVLLADLERLGLRNGSSFASVVSGFLPITSLDDAAALASLRGAMPSRAALRAGDVTSQAVEAMNVDVAASLFGLDGSGVTVGTLSDSYDCLTSAATTAADDVASGDLPTGVTVLAELAPCSGSLDEGRAMMQLIHDVAPGSSQMFHSAFNGYADFAQGILDLADAGANVIVDDIIYFVEPMFQDGIIALAADQVVADGVSFFSSAGNQADKSYESAFRPMASTIGPSYATTFHDFDPGPGQDELQGITLPAGASINITLQWDDPSAETGGLGPGGDFDIYLFSGTTSVVAASEYDNPASGRPFERLFYTNSTGSTLELGLAISLYAVADGRSTPTILKYVNFGSDVVTEYATDSSTSYGHANAAGARSVAAANYADTPRFGEDPPLPEWFTSLGGVPILFDETGNRLSEPEIRAKPDITSVDGTDTTFFGFDSDGTGFPDFFGTSAAAPHAAAVAALVLQLDPSLTPQEVYALLESTAIDMDTPGFDALTGHGLIQADASLAALPGLTLAKGAASPGGDAAAARGESVPVLQLDAVMRDGFPDGTLDDLTVEITPVDDGAQVSDVARVLLYGDADGDGLVDVDAVLLGSAVPNVGGSALLVPPGGAPVVSGETLTLLLVVEFTDTAASVPAVGWSWAAGLPLLLVLTGLRRRRGWLTAPLVALVLAGCSVSNPPQPDPEPSRLSFSLEVTDASATYVDATTAVVVSTLPIEADVFELVDTLD